MIFKKSEKKARKSEREKVEERREEVLSKGRKYKYPLQFAKHRIILLSVVIVIFAVIASTVTGWAMLYKVQSTSDVLYRLTQVLPVSVATVDGEKVRYSDYLMIYRSTITPIEQQQGQLGNDESADTMRAYYKRQALTEAEEYTYALKLARELGVEVSDADIDAAIEKHRTAGKVERSEESFRKILQDNFGLSENEYRRMVYLSLVKQKVSEKIDENALKVSEEVAGQIAEGKSFNAISDKFGGKVSYEETGEMVDLMNIDGGRAEVAMTLSEGQVSSRFISNAGTGYYYVRTLKKNDSKVSYESIEIPFTEFTAKFEKIRAEGGVEERIDLPEIEQ